MLHIHCGTACKARKTQASRTLDTAAAVAIAAMIGNLQSTATLMGHVGITEQTHEPCLSRRPCKTTEPAAAVQAACADMRRACAGGETVGVSGPAQQLNAAYNSSGGHAHAEGGAVATLLDTASATTGSHVGSAAQAAALTGQRAFVDGYVAEAAALRSEDSSETLQQHGDSADTLATWPAPAPTSPEEVDRLKVNRAEAGPSSDGLARHGGSSNELQATGGWMPPTSGPQGSLTLPPLTLDLEHYLATMDGGVTTLDAGATASSAKSAVEWAGISPAYSAGVELASGGDQVGLKAAAAAAPSITAAEGLAQQASSSGQVAGDGYQADLLAAQLIAGTIAATAPSAKPVLHAAASQSTDGEAVRLAGDTAASAATSLGFEAAEGVTGDRVQPADYTADGSNADSTRFQVPMAVARRSTQDINSILAESRTEWQQEATAVPDEQAVPGVEVSCVCLGANPALEKS